MGSKKFRKSFCVYCGFQGTSLIGDHVVARGVVLEEYRQNLPKVPCCDSCNNKKSDLEHYLTATMPFGGRQPNSKQTLQQNEKRLIKNERLRKNLQMGIKGSHDVSSENRIEPTITLPFDGEKLLQLSKFLVRGLSYHHWAIPFSEIENIFSFSPTKPDEEMIVRSVDGMKADHIQGSLGNDVLRYKAWRSTIGVPVSVWWFTFHNGFTVSDELGNRSRAVLSFAGSARFTSKLQKHYQ